MLMINRHLVVYHHTASLLLSHPINASGFILLFNGCFQTRLYQTWKKRPFKNLHRRRNDLFHRRQSNNFWHTQFKEMRIDTSNIWMEPSCQIANCVIRIGYSQLKVIRGQRSNASVHVRMNCVNAPVSVWNNQELFAVVHMSLQHFTAWSWHQQEQSIQWEHSGNLQIIVYNDCI